MHSTPPPSPSSLSPSGLLWRVALFLTLFVAAQTLYSLADDTWVERLVIDHLTVQTAALAIDRIDPAAQVQAVGSRLQAPGGGINVLNGCEGTDVLFLMMAAMLVAPLTWRRRAMGLAIGAVLVFALNQVRVLTLFYAFRTNRELFDMLHGIVAPLLLIFAVTAFFIIWLHLSAPRPEPQTAT